MTQRTLPIDPALARKHAERFRSKIDQDPQTGCHNWTGSLSKWGYGRFWIGPTAYVAHRVAYVLAHGRDIAQGMEIDHLCRNRRCVNGVHLRAVSGIENIEASDAPSAATLRAMRTTATCARGHDLTAPDAWRHNARGRQCRTCLNDASRARYYRRRSLAAQGAT